MYLTARLVSVCRDGMNAAANPVPALVVMGVSGCGKSTLGASLARTLGWVYVEGDDLHPARNVALMAAGTPLTDADRADWLENLSQRLAGLVAQQQGVVATCSALKRSYRDQLRAGVPGLLFVYLHGPQALLAQRLAERKGHYMPASLLQSQLDILQPPQTDEGALAFDISPEAGHLLGAVLTALRERMPQGLAMTAVDHRAVG
jgi:gluconokinase